ncbi:MAG TPA: hypothetical protein VHY58_01410 [Streptosporangiaceae bacterium]|jgi:hypothetical protein|nr:hypothetical protein [Streptosporangiaceae bacterium]
MAKLLGRLLGAKERQPADLITGVAGPGKKGGWSVVWAGDGSWPPRVHAETLTQAADQAAEAVTALYAQVPPVDGANFQLAIYPWDYQGGPMFDVSGGAGAYTAHDIQGSDQSVSGATLEELVEAVHRLADVPDGGSMFRWIRQVATLPLPARPQG